MEAEVIRTRELLRIDDHSGQNSLTILVKSFRETYGWKIFEGEIYKHATKTLLYLSTMEPEAIRNPRPLRSDYHSGQNSLTILVKSFGETYGWKIFEGKMLISTLPKTFLYLSTMEPEAIRTRDLYAYLAVRVCLRAVPFKSVVGGRNGR